MDNCSKFEEEKIPLTPMGVLTPMGASLTPSNIESNPSDVLFNISDWACINSLNLNFLAHNLGAMCEVVLIHRNISKQILN